MKKPPASVPFDCQTLQRDKLNATRAPMFDVPQPARSFNEIAAELGTSRQAVWQAYRSGIFKIRRNPKAAQEFRGLVELRAAVRQGRAA